MTRVELASALTPEQALGWLVSDDRPFALSGDWFGLGGVTILGSEPVRVGDPRHDDPFGLIAEANSDSSDAAVGGGWVGWLGYGLGAEIEALLPPPPPAVPRPRWSLAFYDHVVIHDGERWFFESLTERPDRLDLWRQRLSTEPPPFPEAEPPALAPTGSGGSGHIAAVTELLERIAAGDLYQANLCMRLAGRYSGDPLALFADGLSAGRPRFGACVDGVVSLSPERFLRRHGRNVKTEPIKGTRPLTASAEELAGSAKDAAEHVMIVDLMRNDLGRVCEYGSIFAEPPRVEPHAGVLQLVSTVSGRLRADVDDGALLRAAFPPGSVTGAPKVAAMEAITQLEAVRREAYTGAVGIVSPTAGLDLNVAIRTFELQDDAIWLGVGGGIVADSEPEAELEEAFVKARGPLGAVGGRLLGGRVPKAPAAGLARALDHGSRPDPAHGLFETVLVRDGRTVELAAHLDRLAHGTKALYGYEPEVELPDVSGFGFGRLRVLARPGGEVSVSVKAEAPPEPGAERALLQPWLLPGGLGEFKWQDRRLLDVLAELAPGTVPLLVDGDGAVLEGATMNIWIVEGDTWITPPADGRILAGVTRASVLEATPGAREEVVDLARMRAADRIVLSSSIRGVREAQL